MSGLALRRAVPGDAELLAIISQRAFDSDVAIGAPGPGGPPGYTDPEWQRSMMNRGDYLCLTLGDAIVGGAIVFDMEPGHHDIGRIFLDPDHHRKGLGSQAMRLVMARYPKVRRWTLDTPAWNTRTRAFYEQLGFTEYGRRPVGGDFELILYELRAGA
ncbi:MAG TPA: GNAT family N-acetyltransferase [Acidimicrobiia bacterium]|nr:GNAT family N-acetyltransferase [Acidimicrobiia bacterium]